MNVLHIEEMIQVQKRLLSMPSQQEYRLNLPDAHEIAQLAAHHPKLLSAGSSTAQQEVDKMLTHTKNLRSLQQTDPNANLKVFACAILTLIYPQNSTTNSLLLETLKCTLYSPDIAFPFIQNTAFQLDNLQAKAMLARFLDVLANEREALGINFSKYVELFLQKNDNILNFFAIFFRLVLHKLAVERAEDYTASLEFEEALVNLVEYFDISYRNRAQLFLFYEENVFVAQIGEEVVLGEYLDNEIDPKEVSFKDSKGFNILQSFLLRSSQKGGEPRSFNFVFDSGQLRYMRVDCEQEKSIDLDTPHFNDSTQFVFGKKKKDEEGEELKRHPSRQSLNASIDSFKDFNFNQCMAMLKSIEEREIFMHNHGHSQGKEKHIFETPIKQLDEKLEESKISVDRGKNIVNVKDKHQTLFTPQVDSKAHQCFARFDNDALFLKNSNEHPQNSSSGNIYEARSDFHPYSDCKCKAYRSSRNSIASTVVSFSYVPTRKVNIKAPSFINNLTSSQRLAKCSSSRLYTPKGKRLVTLEEKPLEQAKIERKPTFLKFLKKNRELGEKQSQSSFNKSKKSDQSTPKITGQERFKRSSAIINKAYHENRIKDMRFRQNFPKNDFNNNFLHRNRMENTVLKKFDSNSLLYRPSLGTHWHSATNFHCYPQTTPRRQANDYAKMNNGVTNVYAPTVQVIAPTVYLHANAPNSKTSFSIDSPSYPKEQIYPKDSHRIHRTESSIHFKANQQ